MTASQIKAARERHGHTQTEAAAAVGVSSRTWHNWEAAGAEPRSPAIRERLNEYVAESIRKADIS